MPSYYPVYLDLRNRRCVVVGSGPAGDEKVRRLLDSGAETVVISPDATDAVRGLASEGRLSWVRRGYRAGDLDGAFIAIVADTSDERINRQVSGEAADRNIPVNVMDVTHMCSFIAPAIVQRGDVTVAVSTGGASPALARKFREELSGPSRLRPRHDVMEYADLAPVLADARSRLKRRGVAINADHWQVCLTDDLVDLVQAGKSDQALDVLVADLLTGVECDCPPWVCRRWEDLGVQSGGTGTMIPTSG